MSEDSDYGHGMIGTSGKTSQYAATLQSLPDWDDFLASHSGLPGPRGNLELAAAVVTLGDEARFIHLLSWDQGKPKNSPEEFLVFCGVYGLGKLITLGSLNFLDTLQAYANDNRWRVREAVAMALQWLGDTNLPALYTISESWGKGTLLEKRAALAAICEPALLKQPPYPQKAFDILDGVTSSFIDVTERKSEEFITLRKGLGYCWSVAIAAFPEEGKKRFEHWVHSQDKDIRWVVKENLKKNRLLKMDADWVEKILPDHCRGNSCTHNLTNRKGKSLKRIVSKGLVAFLPLIATILALLIGSVVLLILGKNPIIAYGAMLEGAFGSLSGITQTLVKATPLLLVGLGVTIAFRGGVINIGGEGQIIVGGLAATAAAISMPTLPPVLLIPLTLLAGALGGAVWGGIPGILKAKLG